MAVSTDFLQTWSGTCWWTGLLLNTKYQTRSQFGFCPTRNTNQPLFILRHILATAKKKRMKVFTAFMDLLAAYDSIPREKLWRHLQKNKTPQYLRDIIQMYDIHICTQEASTFLLMATKLPRRLRPTKAWSRAALWVPFCIPFIPMTLTDSIVIQTKLYQWHWQILDRAERCCHCLGFSSGTSLWLCWWHCSHFKHSWMSTAPAKQIPQLHTFQGAQAQHWQN